MDDNTHLSSPVAALYDDLQTALRLRDDVRRAYDVVSRVLMRCLDSKTDFAGVRFGGTFAKVDYLLKEHHAPAWLRRSVNTARVHLRRRRALGEDELAAHLDADVRAVAQFVALLCGSPVPAMLAAARPADATSVAAGPMVAEYIRMVVDEWDDTTLRGDADIEGGRRMTVHYGGASAHAVYSDWDWSYLRDLLHVGSQLNIVRPRDVDGVLYPELIIYEPDYLVDVSAVASCFDSCGATPLHHLLNRLKPTVSTAAIAMGNLASQFLDESLAPPESDVPYAQSVMQFYERNAMSLLTTDIGAEFHAEAQRQRAIVHTTVRHVLPALLADDGIAFDSGDIIVEPSFYSEMLGLQGRLDMMHVGGRVVVEQKAGRGGFPPPSDDTPAPQQKHYIQLLLYMLVMRYGFRHIYERNNRELHAFLFYSKYTNGLLPLGFAPRLVFDAIKMRNQLAASDYGYTRGGLDVLLTLTPDALNTAGARGTLWQRYVRPQIEALLAPIHTATTLERVYYLRLLRFLHTEQLLAKVGHRSKENSGFADKWHSSLADKQLAGTIYSGLTMLSPARGDGGRVERVELSIPQEADAAAADFRRGDIVVLYPYPTGDEPDVRRTMVYRATIASVTTTTLVLELRAAQSNAHIFWTDAPRLWAVEHDLMEASFAALSRGVHAFLSAPKPRRDLILMQREPRCDRSLRTTGDHGQFAELALRTRQARDIYLIVGPPGTGKTSFGLMTTLREELLDPTTAVLLLACTNRAVDEICSHLLADGIDFLRIGGRQTADETCQAHLLDAQVTRCGSVARLADVVRATRVYVGTTTAVNACTALFALRRFTLAIVDEASQILEPHLLGLLGAYGPDGHAPAIDRLVLIGDHKQLPAVVRQDEWDSRVDEPELRAIGLVDCRRSLFERLLERYRDNPEVVYTLSRQGRMHRDVAQFASHAFYGDRLRVVPLPHQDAALPQSGRGEDGIEDLLTTRRIAFVAVVPTADTTASVQDKVNTPEARAIAATALRIYRLHEPTFSAERTLGIIVPYRSQIAEVRRHLAATGHSPLLDVTVDTVERFQGSQRDYILYGCTVQRPYQLDFLTSSATDDGGVRIDRRLNVSMTRAREHFIMFGNPNILSMDATHASLLSFIRKMGGYVDCTLERYVAGGFRLPERGNDAVDGAATSATGPTTASLTA